MAASAALASAARGRAATLAVAACGRRGELRRCHWLARRAFSTGDTGGAAAAPEAAAQQAAAPLSLTEKLQLYRSPTDLAAAAQQASSQGLLAAAFSVLGFAGVIVGSPTHPAALHGMLCMGAFMATYKHVVMTRKELASIGMRHLESLTLLPTAAPAAAEVAGAGGAAETGAASAADAAAHLQATPELELLLRTANVDLRLKLTEPAAAWEGAKYSGLITDDRTSFQDVLKVLYLDEVSGWGKQGSPASQDAALLAAVLATDKVVAEHSVEVRTDLEGGSVLAAPMDGAAQLRKLLDKVPAAIKASGGNSGERMGMPKTALLEIQQIGRQSLISGLIFFAAGTIYIGRWFKGEGDGKPASRDPKEPTNIQDLIDLWKARFTQPEQP